MVDLPHQIGPCQLVELGALAPVACACRQGGSEAPPQHRYAVQAGRSQSGPRVGQGSGHPQRAALPLSSIRHFVRKNRGAQRTVRPSERQDHDKGLQVRNARLEAGAAVERQVPGSRLQRSAHAAPTPPTSSSSSPARDPAPDRSRCLGQHRSRRPVGLARLDARRSSSAANRGHGHGQRRRDVSGNIRRSMAGL